MSAIELKTKVKGVTMRLFGVGSPSMMRVLTCFVVVDIMVMWNITIIKNDWDMQDFPYGVVAIFSAMVLGKMGQRFAENGEGKKEKEIATE